MKSSRATINGITGYIQNGTAYLRLTDLAVCMGFSQRSPDGSLQPNWEALSPILERLGLSSSLCSEDSFVPVSIFHCLAEEIGTPVAQRFQTYVDHSVIPALQGAASSPAGVSSDLPSSKMEQQSPAPERLDEAKEHPRELQSESEQSGESNVGNNDVFIEGADRTKKEKTVEENNSLGLKFGCAITLIVFVVACVWFALLRHNQKMAQDQLAIEERFVQSLDSPEESDQFNKTSSTSEDTLPYVLETIGNWQVTALTTEFDADYQIIGDALCVSVYLPMQKSQIKQALLTPDGQKSFEEISSVMGDMAKQAWAAIEQAELEEQAAYSFDVLDQNGLTLLCYNGEECYYDVSQE